jgi:hypothetical protein
MSLIQTKNTGRSNKLRVIGICIAIAITAFAALHLLRNRDISVETISGLYRAHISTRLSQLKLNRDGSFIHQFSDDTHPSLLATKANIGTWDIEETKSGKHVVLYNFVSFAGEEGVLGFNVNGGWFLLLIDKFFGRVQLIYDVGLGLAYDKISSK